MISVIIPAYNAQAYLRECLESVLAQSYTDWEAVIVDDGSTDSTLGIARSYAGRDNRIKVVSTPNRGQASARNVALETVGGQWITYIDSDDSLHPMAFARMLDVAESSGADVVSAGYVKSVGGISVTTTPPQIITGKEANESCLYQTQVSTSACAKLFRREAVKGIKFPDGVYYEDILYCVETFRRVGKVAVIPDKLYYYRDNPSSFINTFSPKRLDALRITAMVEEMSADDADLLRAARDRRLSANFNLFGLLSVWDKEGKYNDVKRGCWDIIRAYRCESLRNRHVRLKNKIGVLLSYMGPRVLGYISKAVY